MNVFVNMSSYLLMSLQGEASFYQIFLVLIGVAASSYLLGSLCFAIIFTKIFIKRDIRKLGSGTAGAANVLRSVGFVAGLLTILFDFIKGVISVYIGYYLFQSVGIERYAGGCFATIFVLVGHFYPIYFKYKGGKGVVTMGGIVAVLHWKLFILVTVVYLILLWITKTTSIAALVTFIVLPLANIGFCLYENNPWVISTVLYLIVSILIFYTHRGNMKRIRDGTEQKLVVKKNVQK